MSVAAQAEGHTQCLAVTAGGARLFFFLLSGPNRASGVTVPNKFFYPSLFFGKKKKKFWHILSGQGKSSGAQGELAWL